MMNPHSSSKDTLARVFPAFGKPAQPIDARPDARADEPWAPPQLRITKAANPLGTGASAVMQDLAPPRMGHISFANCLPIVLPIERAHVQLDAQIVFASPAELNGMFEKGLLDLGAMSSYYFLKQANLTLCPDISISCIGPVGSVLLFAKCEPEELVNRKLACSATSATSVNLLRVLFAEQFGTWPEMVADERPNLDSPEFDGALVIGDYALEVDEDWSQKYIRIDLGEWWHQKYRLPMVFGVWAARSQWVDKNHYRFAEICRALRTSKLLGLTRRWKDTLHEAHRRTGLSLDRLERYYRQELNFDFEVEHSEGLAQYQMLLQKYKL